MAGCQEIFQRIEKKYLLTSNQFVQMKQAIEPYMQIDDYGLTTICNIYYDTDDYWLIRCSLDKPPYKEKLRVRSYSVPRKPTDLVFVEIKKKCQGIVYKRRVSMTLQESRAYLQHGIMPQANPQILKELNYFIRFYRPRPAYYIAYDRIALFGRQDAELRMTFDQRIRSRNYDLDLAEGDEGTLLMDDDYALMEIKVPGAYPLWMAEILTDLKIYPTTFSKYGRIYQKELQIARGQTRRLEDGKRGKIVCLPV